MECLLAPSWLGLRRPGGVSSDGPSFAVVVDFFRARRAGGVLLAFLLPVLFLLSALGVAMKIQALSFKGGAFNVL